MKIISLLAAIEYAILGGIDLYKLSKEPVKTPIVIALYLFFPFLDVLLWVCWFNREVIFL